MGFFGGLSYKNPPSFKNPPLIRGAFLIRGGFLSLGPPVGENLVFFSSDSVENPLEIVSFGCIWRRELSKIFACGGLKRKIFPPAAGSPPTKL